MYEYRATLRRIVDGDTIDVDIDCGFDIVLSNQRIRLYGIDTPECRTRDPEEKKCGLLAKKFIEENLPTTFTLRTRLDGKGKYGRILGELVTHYKEFDREMSLNKVMIMKNLAVEYYGQSKEEIEEQHLANREILYESGLVVRG